jgi:MATE family multidrug resistance protein
MDTPYRAPTLRGLFTLAWPVILARAAQSVVGFTDAVFVASLGPDALAATGNGALNAFAVFMLPLGVAFIVQSFAAQLHGGGDLVKLRRYGWYGLGLAGLAQAAALAFIPAVPWLLARADYTPAVRGLMAEYVAIRLLGVGAAVGTEALGNWFGGQGNTRVGLVASVIVMVLNVPLAWLFIHGGLGVPAMGVRGAAIASVVATCAGLAYAGAAFEREGRSVEGSVGWRGEEFRRMLRFGLPNGVNWFLEFAAFLFFIDVVFAGMGTAALAGLMAVLQLNSVAFMPAFGLSSAGAIHVGQAIGRKALDVVPRLVRRTTLVACAWMGAVGVLYALTPRLLLHPFAPGDPAARAAFVEAAVPLLRVAVAWQLFDATAMAIGEALRAAGDTAWPMRARIAVSWGLFVPVTIATARAGAGPAVTLAWVVVYMGALTALLVWRFRSGAWRAMELTGEG